MVKEIELKLRIEKGADGVLEKLRACLQAQGLVADFSSKTLFNIYYDTSERLLNQHKMALRIRKLPDGYVQTLKTKGKSVDGLSERGEWEWVLPEHELDSSVLVDLEVWPAGMELSNLRPAFETNFVRQEALVTWQGAQIEIAYDLGEVISGNKSAEINELELELKSGEVEALKSLAVILTAEIALEPFDISKAERGYALAGKD